MPPTDHLLVERDGHIVTLTMNRPEAKNALSSEMVARLADAWDMIDGDRDIRVAILTGTKDVFSAGADLKSMFNPDPNDRWAQRFQEEPDLAWKALLRSRTLTKPLIAAVEGPAVAGGTEILQSTDIRVAGRSAVFGLAEVKRGLFPVGGSTVRLKRQIPWTKAMEVLLTGDHFSADEALAMGLIGHVVDDGKALDKATEIARRIADNAPLSVMAIKRSVIETAWLPEEEALAKEFEIGWPCFQTKDAREGTKAFAEKRKPNFTGE